MNKKFFYRCFAIVALISVSVFTSKSAQASLNVSHSKKVFVKDNNPSNSKQLTPIAKIIRLQLTASDKELISHNYPSKPKNRKDLAECKKAVSVKLV